ncbi:MULTISPECIES: anthranilate synthase component I family protein [Flavobacteriaceae]|uniref:anthranilate synthase component I family protein n=1 Tax=Flavobacteriaceae TaxID=49546 RepID=UPI0014927EE4|nr:MULTISPECIES: anthranilate synthase component I family protein [Allomuricauda]MDC6364846.1 anthranilate synthase component I family protein [Muricauda sp. AC10]
MREHRSFAISDSDKIKEVLLEWSNVYPKVVWLDSNGHLSKYSSFDAILAISKQTDKSDDYINNIDEIQNFTDKEQDWLFGYLTYDIKNRFENLVSDNFDGLNFPEIQFFQPSKIIILKEGKLNFLYLQEYAHEIENDFSEILEFSKVKRVNETGRNPIKIKMRIHKDAYFEKAHKFLEHIHRGDIYEANFCQEFYAENTLINPLRTYLKLNEISKPPFAAYFRLGIHYLMCTSPERYLKKQGQTVVSQPIKGTAARGVNQKEDEVLKKRLFEDEKERAENIMITDLVRNDLSKSALNGTVQVEELCKVYSFEQVHQLISTITSKVSKSQKSLELIKDTFPMGSMTGAPKISAMKIIEELEETKRGLYSGAVGYFDPKGNFDFNVVIRSILYNSNTNYVSFSVGSAITAKSDPEKEYQECLLKAKAMRNVLETS